MDDGRVAVRSTRTPDLAPTVVDADEWADFVSGVREGSFDQV